MIFSTTEGYYLARDMSYPFNLSIREAASIIWESFKPSSETVKTDTFSRGRHVHICGLYYMLIRDSPKVKVAFPIFKYSLWKLKKFLEFKDGSILFENFRPGDYELLMIPEEGVISMKRWLG